MVGNAEMFCYPFDYIHMRYPHLDPLPKGLLLSNMFYELGVANDAGVTCARGTSFGTASGPAHQNVAPSLCHAILYENTVPAARFVFPPAEASKDGVNPSVAFTLECPDQRKRRPLGSVE